MKLHLGCGERNLNGYVHVDIAEFDHIDYVRPVDDLSCFEKNTISSNKKQLVYHAFYAIQKPAKH